MNTRMNANWNVEPQGGAGQLRSALAGNLSRHWGWFLFEGLVLIVLGVAAMLLPGPGSLAAAWLLGWLLLLAGIARLIATIRSPHAPGFGWSLLSALLALGAGAVLLLMPIQAVISLTAVLIAFLAVDGVIAVFYALEHRNRATGNWAWMLFSGAIDILLAVLLLAGFPGTAFWALGLMLGINLCFVGWSLVMMALAARPQDGGTQAASGSL
jgi:uncharacterized membrane protein HdeD (DUF308 family)